MLNHKSPENVAVITIIILLVAACARPIENNPNLSGTTMEFVRIPVGGFYKEPTLHVQINKPFYMGKYEVTQAQWQAVMGTTVSQQRNNTNFPWHLKGVGPDHPIYYVSWEEPAEFCKRLGRNYRLPSESEWEYACRAGSQTDFYYGNDPNYLLLDSHAWHFDNSKGSTHPVGQKKPNKWGLYDMYGNVAEWCSDKHASNRFMSIREAGHVCRGGSWLEEPNKCSSVYSRYSSHPFDFIGFRVVFTGNIENDKEILQITLPKKTARLNIFQKLKSKIISDTQMATAGVVRDQKGLPVADIDIAISPLPNYWDLRLYPEGKFEAHQYKKNSQTNTHKYRFWARHLQRNLFACMEFHEDVNNLDIKLEPGAILTGKVADANGKGIQAAEIVLYSTNVRMLPLQAMTDSGTDGKFEIKGLPTGHKYRLTIRATGYRVNNIEFQTNEIPESRIDLDPIIMARGQFSVSGVVVDKIGKPVANATVQCFIEDPVNIFTTTDEKGRFTAYGIFEGPVIVTAQNKEESSGDLWYGQKHSYSGATNVKVVLRQKTNYGR